MKKLIASLLLALAFCAALPAHADQQPDAATQAIFKTLITATLADDYDAFISVSDDAVKGALTKQMLDGVSHQLTGRTKQGYDATYLGELNKDGYQVNLWRLRFKDGGNDMLCTLSVKDGKAGGFYLH